MYGNVQYYITERSPFVSTSKQNPSSVNGIPQLHMIIWFRLWLFAHASMVLDVSPISLGDKVYIFLEGKGMNKFASKFSNDSFLMALANLS